MESKLLIDSRELSKMLSVSLKWVIKHRHKIVGSQKLGKLWRFNKAIIENRISKGLDVIR